MVIACESEVKVLLSRVQLFVSLWTVASQAPLETCVLSHVKWIAGPGSMHETGLRACALG